MAENIMAQIPGEFLVPSRYALPHAELARGDTISIDTEIAVVGAVRITFRRMSHRHGRFRNWFWTPTYAELSGHSLCADDTI